MGFYLQIDDIDLPQLGAGGNNGDWENNFKGFFSTQSARVLKRCKKTTSEVDLVVIHPAILPFESDGAVTLGLGSTQGVIARVTRPIFARQ